VGGTVAADFTERVLEFQLNATGLLNLPSNYSHCCRAACSACGQLVPGMRDIGVWGNSLPPQMQREETNSYMKSFTGSVSICCLELLETIFDGVERLSRRVTVLHQLAPQLAAGRDTGSKRAMKASAK